MFKQVTRPGRGPSNTARLPLNTSFSRVYFFRRRSFMGGYLDNCFKLEKACRTNIINRPGVSHVMCQMSCVMCQMSGVKCHVSNVKCHVSNVRCQMSRVTCQLSPVRWQVSHKIMDKVVELVGWGSCITGAYPV